ncbi:MAG: tRNA (guanosine(46)-N7)-methyltransferase TrmB [Porphyromonadaceae bacterium]|nr:MAG: tRNA (guanosine(46)-N7)-methyltransferase TrmB [Porphyromonadaceae bacterium]
MGRISKIKRFDEMREFPHVFEPDGNAILTSDYEMKGCWNQQFFRNEKPIILELGCGRGEYTVELAKRSPEFNFIGVDIKGARMWKGAQESLRLKLDNVAFLRCRIEFLFRMFAQKEITEIWITFPDPQARKPRKRLTSSRFINMYMDMLNPGGRIHLKTDSPILYEYTVSLLKWNGLVSDRCTTDLYASGLVDEVLSIRTHYESGFLQVGKPITYLSFVPVHGRRWTEPREEPDQL